MSETSPSTAAVLGADPGGALATDRNRPSPLRYAVVAFASAVGTAILDALGLISVVGIMANAAVTFTPDDPGSLLWESAFGVLAVSLIVNGLHVVTAFAIRRTYRVLYRCLCTWIVVPVALGVVWSANAFICAATSGA